MVGEAAPVATDDPRAGAAKGTTITFPPRAQGGLRSSEYVEVAVLDTKSGATLHKPQRINEALPVLVEGTLTRALGALPTGALAALRQTLDELLAERGR